MQHKNETTSLDASAFLRSINICYDASEAKRIAHFRPTTKSCMLLKSLMAQGKDRAFFIVAPYGSGKSINAAYILHLVENRKESTEVLKILERRFSQISPDVFRMIRERRYRKRKGIVVALHGYQNTFPLAIKTAVQETILRNKLGRQFKSLKEMPCSTIEEAINILQFVKNKCKTIGIDRIIIIWDECGRHIESKINHGRAVELSDIQLLAEYVSRSSDFPITLSLILHQNLLHHAGQMNQSIRAEWMKISGRFKTIQYIDDSKEIYRLIGEIISTNRKRIPIPSKKQIRQVARYLKKDLGLFADHSLQELVNLLIDTYPIEPIPLYVLPRLSARVAQNERTLFTFLYSMNKNELIDLPCIYDYFSPSMRADTTVGGTYKVWLETQSAISKIGANRNMEKVLKSVCLLGIGTRGERSRAGSNLVLFALNGYHKNNDWWITLKKLCDRKLLIHRKHNDELSVWHGTDVDLRGRLEEEKNNHRISFKLSSFLSKGAKPTTWKPVQYNSVYGVTRFWSGEYVSIHDFTEGFAKNPELNIPINCDGKIFYIIAENNDDISISYDAVNECSARNRIIFVIPNEPLQLQESALEVWCLTQMYSSPNLIGSDPMLVPELQQMLDDAVLHLQRKLDLLTQPHSGYATWYYKGKDLHITDATDLRKKLSEITTEIFSQTPRIHNELIVRKKPSGTIVNSRKKLILAMLERHGLENFDIRGKFPDYSMFRTVLLHTGLYRESSNNKVWKYADVSEVSDPGLASVWERLKIFFSTPEKEPKRPENLLNELRSPPYGLREGLLPIIFTAGMKAFGKVISLKYKGEYVKDILPGVIEDLCRNPGSYRLSVLDLNETTIDYLRKFHTCFSQVTSYPIPEKDLIRLCYDALSSWKFQLPSAAMTTRKLTPHAKVFQKVITAKHDPVHLLLTEIPTACGISLNNSMDLINKIWSIRDELENVTHSYVDQASETIRKAIGFDYKKKKISIREIAYQWASKFPEKVVNSSLLAMAKGLLQRMKKPYKSDDLLIDSISLLLIGKPIVRWEDSTCVDFDNKFQEVVHKIEETAITSSATIHQKEVMISISELICQRIIELHQRLQELVGEEEANKLIKSEIMKKEFEEKYDKIK